MVDLKFEMNLPADNVKLFQIATDYENIQNFFTRQLESVKIIAMDENTTTTEEQISLTSFIKAKFTQQTIHEIKRPNTIVSKVISGPFSGSTLNIVFEKMDEGTKIMVAANLKISLKYKILVPVIKKYYKTILMGLLYKMNTLALKTS
ncbi:hypothetical protein [Candidatus Nitrosotenuis cloacae]|uniref:hypothetical protein n=1 Tax=Candidatus Nitrosotenuis cloacae TaxID=1603555 RepID=UPI00227F6E8B|nr:hypothetical protein [Candidatus Nitrosotenuis cloacae]